MRTVCRNRKAWLVKDADELVVFFVSSTGELKRDYVGCSPLPTEEESRAAFEARFGPALEVGCPVWGGLHLTPAGEAELCHTSPHEEDLF